MKRCVHLCRVLSLDNLYVTDIFRDFSFRNSIICSSIDLEQIAFFEKCSLSNAKISQLLINFVIFNSARDCPSLYLKHSAFCQWLYGFLKFVSVIRFCSSSKLTRSFYFCLGGLISNVPFYLCLCKLPFGKYRFRLKEINLLQLIVNTCRNKTCLTI